MHFCIGVILVLFSQICFGDEIENKLIESINDIDDIGSIDIIGGLTVNKMNSAKSFHVIPKSLPERVEQYLSTHELNWQLPNSKDDPIVSRPYAEARTKKLRKILLPLMLALKLKLAVIMKLMIVFVKFISLKALASSLLALLFTGSSLIKEFINKKKDHVTTAYITGAPLNAEVIHADWSRNGQVAAQELAYGGYQSLPSQPI